MWLKWLLSNGDGMQSAKQANGNRGVIIVPMLFNWYVFPTFLVCACLHALTGCLLALNRDSVLKCVDAEVMLLVQ